MRWIAAAALVLGCSKAEPTEKKPMPQLSPAEIQRSQDACKAYVERVCACMAPAAKQQCTLAKALPDAIQLSLSVSANPASSRNDVFHAIDSVRKTTKECIEETARLPALGCP